MLKYLPFVLLSLLLLPGFSFPDPFAESIKRGEMVYMTYCLSCHMADGQGLPKIYPPLAKSDYLMEDKERSIIQVLYGAQGKVIVNGVLYNSLMPGTPLDNQQVADVLNYIRNSWGNKGEIVTAEEVMEAKKNRK